MSYSKDDPNQCSKEFVEYLKKAGCILNKEASTFISNRIVKIQDERCRRELMQACNLELTIEACEELFPALMKSKEIKREEIDEILREVSNQKMNE
jgi:hypothetical protein